MADTKYTPEAVRAAERIARIDWIKTGRTEYDKLKLETIAAMIDQETGLLKLQARIKELGGELFTLITFSADLQQSLEAEKAELVEALEDCVDELWQLHEQIHPDCIADRPKRCPSRASIESGRALLAKAEPPTTTNLKQSEECNGLA